MKRQYIKMATEDIRNAPAEVRARVAADPTTRPSVLTKLSDDNDPTVADGLARNPNTPPEVLRKLVDKPTRYTFIYIAANPNLPLDILKRFVYSSDITLRYYAIQNPNLPVEIMHEIVDSYKSLSITSSLISLSRNPSIPDDVIDFLLSLDNGDIDDNLMENTGVPIDLRMQLAYATDAQIEFCFYVGNSRDYDFADIERCITAVLNSSKYTLRNIYDDDYNVEEDNFIQVYIYTSYIPDEDDCKKLAVDIESALESAGYSVGEWSWELAEDFG